MIAAWAQADILYFCAGFYGLWSALHGKVFHHYHSITIRQLISVGVQNFVFGTDFIWIKFVEALAANHHAILRIGVIRTAFRTLDFFGHLGYFQQNYGFLHIPAPRLERSSFYGAERNKKAGAEDGLRRPKKTLVDISVLLHKLQLDTTLLLTPLSIWNSFTVIF